MSHNTRIRRFLTIAFVAAFVVAACPYAMAQEDGEQGNQSSTNLKIGVINFDVLSEEYQTLTEKRTEVREWSESKRSMLEQLRNYVYLSEENFQEVIDLLKVAPPIAQMHRKIASKSFANCRSKRSKSS